MIGRGGRSERCRLKRRSRFEQEARRRRVLIAAIYALVLIFALPVSALAGERVDLFDKDGRRTGYGIVDHQSGRVDLYDRDSRRTGWGRITPSGRVELFDPRGRRQGEGVIRSPRARGGPVR